MPKLPSKFAKLTAWSYSRYTDWLKCPLLCALKHVMKQKEPDNKFGARGTLIHDLAKGYVEKKIKTLPPELETFEEEFIALRKQATVKCEQDWAFKDNFAPTSWFGSDAWLRIKMDAAYTTKVGKELWAVVIDYKTGKVYDDHPLQRSLYALGAFLMFRGIAGVKVEHWYIDQAAVQRSTFKTTDFVKLKAEWLSRTEDMLDDEHFRPRANPGCQYCHFRASNGGPCKHG